MPHKTFVLDEHISITIYKRQRSRSLRLSIAANGSVRVSIPAWAPYASGLSFARSRQAWIQAQQRLPQLLRDGQPIGKAHHLRLLASAAVTKSSTRLKGAEAIVVHPSLLSSDDPGVQLAARLVGLRALRIQAEKLLPQRLADLAAQHGYSYNDISVRQLKSRWGSCDSQANIVLSIFLMQLPWECIDYVLLHELTHTKVMQHGPKFWQTLEAVLPTARQLRKTLRNYQPALQ